MLKIAIVDDENTFCTELDSYLLELSKELNIDIETELYYCGKSFCFALDSGTTFDLIFLDIELQDMTGIDVSKYIRDALNDELISIVFVSAKEEYSLALHTFHPLDFLVKNITKANLERVLKRFLRITNRWNDLFEFKSGHEIHKIRIKVIQCLTVANRCVYVVLSDGRSLNYYGTLENAYETQLKKHGFIFLHKQYLINPDFVEIYEYDKVIMRDGKTIPIGSSRRKEIRALQLLSKEKKEAR